MAKRSGIPYAMHTTGASRMPRKQKNASTMEVFRFKEGAVNRASSQLALIKSEKLRQIDVVSELLPPGCDLCSEPIAAHVIVETEDEVFEPMDLCARHLDHLRQYLGAERYQAALESDESKIA